MIVVVRVSEPVVPVTVMGTGCVPGLVGAVMVRTVVWPPGTAVWLKLQLAPLGSPEHDELFEKLTVVAPNEPMETTVIVVVPEPPDVVTAAGLADSTKSLVGLTFQSVTRL